MDESSPPRPLPGPRHATVAPSADRGTSRRWFLAGAAAVLLGGGAGVAAEFVHTRHPAAPPSPPGPPAALSAAAVAERRLIADLDATTGGTPAVRQIIVAARADHADHLAALEDLLATYPAPGPAPDRLPGKPRTRAQLRTAEQRASSAAARHAEALDGARAALLASISACEATHAELMK